MPVKNFVGFTLKYRTHFLILKIKGNVSIKKFTNTIYKILNVILGYHCIHYYI